MGRAAARTSPWPTTTRSATRDFVDGLPDADEHGRANDQCGVHRTCSPLNPLGRIGLGEIGAVGAVAVATNAVSDALAHMGVEVVETPHRPGTLRGLKRTRAERDDEATRRRAEGYLSLWV
jgi:hypothetical protein